MNQLRLARPVRDEAHRTRGRNRIVRHFEPGSSSLGLAWHAQSQAMNWRVL